MPVQGCEPPPANALAARDEAPRRPAIEIERRRRGEGATQSVDLVRACMPRRALSRSAQTHRVQCGMVGNAGADDHGDDVDDLDDDQYEYYDYDEAEAVDDGGDGDLAKNDVASCGRMLVIASIISAMTMIIVLLIVMILRSTVLFLMSTMLEARLCVRVVPNNVGSPAPSLP